MTYSILDAVTAVFSAFVTTGDSPVQASQADRLRWTCNSTLLAQHWS